MLKHSLHKSDSFLNFLHQVEEGKDCLEQNTFHQDLAEHFDQAKKLGVSHILYYRLKQSRALSRLPDQIAKQCQKRFYWSHARNMKRFGRLKEVLQAFSLEEIPVIALKGAVLANLVYPHMGLRPMSDVDLLVHEEHLGKAEHLLHSLGCHENETNHSREWYRNHHHHLVPYVSRDGSLIIEVHRQLIPLEAPITIPNHDLWKRSNVADIVGKSCRVLSPEDLLIHLSLHLAVDSYIGKLRTLYDLKETIKHYEAEIDWDTLLKLAKEYKISKYLFYAFGLTKGTLNANIPQNVLDTLQSRFGSVPFEDRFMKRIIRKGIVLADPNAQPLYAWILGSGCVDIFSGQARMSKILNVFHRSKERYIKFSNKHAQQLGVSSRWFLMVGYPVYLFRKAIGVPVMKSERNNKRIVKT